MGQSAFLAFPLSCPLLSHRGSSEREGVGALACSLGSLLICSANMLENVSDNAKRFVPPPPRTRSINRRKSGDRYDKVNYAHGTDGEKSQASYPRNFPVVEHGEIASGNVANENTHPKLIPLEGCSTSEAVQFLAERWVAVVRLLDDPSADVSGKPVMYSGASGSSWVHFKLPHQMDFLGELQRKIHKANSSAGSTTSDDS